MTRHIRLVAFMTSVIGLMCLVSPSYASGIKFDSRLKPNGPARSIQWNDGAFSGDNALVWNTNHKTLSISRDAGQTGLALVISSDTGAALANISHDGAAYLDSLTTNLDVRVTGSDIILGNSGVQMTGDGDGQITFLGLGNGTDEDFSINLDDTTQVVDLSSTTGANIINWAPSGNAIFSVTSSAGTNYTIYRLNTTGNDWEIDLGGPTVTDIPHQIGFYNLTHNSGYALTLSSDVSAVNNLRIKNAISTASPDIAAVGTDANINVRVSPKGTGSFAVVKTTGTAQVTMEGTLGGCIMLRDTDNAGWTECDALDGTLSCSIDVDALCD